MIFPHLFDVTIDVLVQSAIAIVTTTTTIYIRLKQLHDEQKDSQTRIETSINDLSSSVKSMKREIKDTRKELNVVHNVTHSQIRINLYRMLSEALERGHTTSDESLEIAKLYSTYKQDKGNGEIKVMYELYRDLEVMR